MSHASLPQRAESQSDQAKASSARKSQQQCCLLTQMNKQSLQTLSFKTGCTGNQEQQAVCQLEQLRGGPAWDKQLLTSEHLELRTDLAALLHCLDGLPQQAGMRRGEGYGCGIAWCVVQDEGGEGVKQEYWSARSY